jgi:imidazolonepropionase-like amidohydrolase
MRQSFLVAAVAAAALSIASGQSPGAESRPVIFENVNIIPMDSERAIERQTVLVRDGRIAQIGAAGKVKVPEGALRVSGLGKFLMPGLAEMHGHLPLPGASEESVESWFFLYVANGVTMVRGMVGNPINLEQRARIAAGRLLGPTLHVAGPAFTGRNAPTTAIAAQMVRDQKAAGYDLLKFLDSGITLEVYDAIAKTANEVHIPYAGHVPDLVGVEHAIEARQSTIEHLDHYIQAMEADNSPIRNADANTRAKQLPFHLDESKMAKLAQKTREAGVWNVPTMAVWEDFYSRDTGEELLKKKPELQYFSRTLVDQWVRGKDALLKPPVRGFMGFVPASETGDRVLEVRRKILKELHEAGARIALGTDSPQSFSVPGFSIHHEMPIMVACGFTPFEVLQSGTRAPAEYFGELAEFGTVEVGKRADLILLEANPLKDVGNISHRTGVMVRGRWLPEREIQERLKKIAAAAAK